MMRSVGSNAVTRTSWGSALSTGARQGAPSPGDDDEESMSTGIRELVLGWGGSKPEAAPGDQPSEPGEPAEPPRPDKEA